MGNAVFLYFSFNEKMYTVSNKPFQLHIYPKHFIGKKKNQVRKIQFSHMRARKNTLEKGSSLQ